VVQTCSAEAPLLSCTKGGPYDLADVIEAAEENDGDYEKAFKDLVLSEAVSLHLFMSTDPTPPSDPTETLGDTMRRLMG
jgi:hypothetical protein